DLEEDLKLQGYSGIGRCEPAMLLMDVPSFGEHHDSSWYMKSTLNSTSLDSVTMLPRFVFGGIPSFANSQNPAGSGSPDLSTSSSNANKVVTCNIHVLYNPKRGDIKLGQVRVLLTRAKAVSKLWNDAPVIICGDFNCTPKSPLYNFISDQQLKFSGLDRDQISGQYSAQINTPKPYWSNPGNGLNRTSIPNNSFGAFNGVPDMSHDSCSNVASEEELKQELLATYYESDLKHPILKHPTERRADVNEKVAEFSLKDVDRRPDSAEAHQTSKKSDSVSDNSEFSPAHLGVRNASSSSFNSELADNENNTFDPYFWTPTEIEIASGNAECTLLEHSLKLRSTYADVEDYSGTNDSNREPQVTSYNRRFMGTVDYIWCSEGLQTVKVLDTIPKHVMQRTSGFPTPRIWGEPIRVAAGSYSSDPITILELRAVDMDLTMVIKYNKMDVSIGADSTTVLNYLTDRITPTWDAKNMVRRIKLLIGQLNAF
ncbi:hypothetical protein GIB67_036884, partial [Kingdonia uniflora]